MSLETLTIIHVAISLMGIASGFVFLLGLLMGNYFPRWNAVFLATTVATSATGFAFPFVRLLPSHVFGAISLVVLAISIVALYRYELAGGWRKTYFICAAIALYLNVFVGIAQSFQKISALRALAPTQSEPPFAIVQLLVLALFSSMAVAGWLKWSAETPRSQSTHHVGAL